MSLLNYKNRMLNPAVKITGLAGGMHRVFKVVVPAADTDLERFANRNYYSTGSR